MNDLMGYLKKFFLLFIPPIFVRLLNPKKNQYVSKFDTYTAAQSKSDVYFDKKATEKFLGPNDVEISGRFNIIPLLVLSLNKKKIEILDYGGGSNPVFSYIEKATNKKIKTYVVEPESFCRIILKKIPKKYKKYVNYISSLKKLKTKSLDIVCFNSSIQYLENYKSIIKKLVKLRPKYILITRTNFHYGKKNYFTLECGIKGSLHPYTFFSFSDFVKFMKYNRYNLVFSNKYNINKYRHEYIDGKTFFHKDIIFEKF